MVNSEESFIGDEEPKKVDDDEGKPLYQGKILITRYQPSLNATHNASIATVNALQEPGSITTLLPKLGQGEPFRRIPHLIDVLTMIDRNFPRRINEETHTHRFMRGVESEADWFFKVRPAFFFVNCFVMHGIDQNGVPLLSSYKLFPVILKQDTYYLIIGEEGTPLYRVLNPRKLFFTMEGRATLKSILSTNHRRQDERLEFYEKNDGVEAYCVPNIQCNLDKWDKCTVSQIEEYMSFPVVNEPVVPAGSKTSVQIIDLNDDEKIVDIMYGL
mmetsp:Transcript_12071/g.19915  ORF Transcript_12071/g.19915 Transcript_12071/m.19915 type:complete len:272 (-) Transcript_12071:52-867(-)